MGKLLEVIKHERVYAVLLFLVVAVNVMAVADMLGERSVVTGIPGLPGKTSSGPEDFREGETRKMFDLSEASERQKRVEELSKEDPLLYFFIAVLNLAILFAIMLGLGLDILLAARRIRGEKLDIRLAGVEEPAWNVPDVLRVVILFLFSGYVFAFFQTVISEKFPVLRNMNFRMVSDTAFMNLAAISVILYFVFRKYSQTRSAIGLAPVSPLKAVVTAAAGYLAVLPVLTATMVLTFLLMRKIGYEPPVQPIVEVFMEEKEGGVLLVSALFAAIFGPVAEEVFFRGFMYPAVRKKWGVAAGIIGTSVIFSALHTHMAGFLPIMILGMLLAYLYERTGSLLVPMAVHMAHNIGMVFMVFIMRIIEA